LSAVLASPFENTAIISRRLFSTNIGSSAYPLLSSSAFFKTFIISLMSRGFKTNTLERDSKAELTSKDGFSVVAPIRTISPFSTWGRKASC